MKAPAQPFLLGEFRDLLLKGLADDDYGLDWTTLGTSSRAKSSKAKIITKADGVFFGVELARAAAQVSESIGLPFKVKVLVEDGVRMKSGTKVVELSGNHFGILALERPYLNLTGYLSGISTRTQNLASLVAAEWKLKRHAEKPPRVTSTRKILPHYRKAAIAAVMAGGGSAHRVGLSGGVLIKENHIASAGGIRPAIQGAREAAPHGLRIEVEVRNTAELKQAINERADIIMLDNFTPSAVASALKRISDAHYSPLIECSGGISETTIAQYSLPGVHFLSLGGLTHSVTALDLSLLIT